jgi:methylmalonyl-CoA/ethylmalonyl-CoA epimerase
MSRKPERTPGSDGVPILTELLGDSLIGIDHVAVAVVDLDEAIAWYTKALGFRLRERRTTRGARTSMISAVLEAGSSVVVLVQGIEPESQVSRFVEQFGPGIQHLAFGLKDLSAVVQRLADAGEPTDTPMMEEPGIRQVFLRRHDGNGVRIELIERNGGDFSDASVERLFRSFEERDLY